MSKKKTHEKKDVARRSADEKRTAARKARHLEDNETRHRVNVRTLAELNVAPRKTTVMRMHHGEPKAVTKDLSPGKLLNRHLYELTRKP